MTHSIRVRALALTVSCWLIGVAAASADVYSRIVNFGDDGQPVAAMTVGADGKLYGTAMNGGLYGYGSVFTLDPSSPTPSITTLYSFTGTSDGAHPACKLVLASDGNFYGTTSAAGPSGPSGGGTIFRMTPSGMLTTLASFGFNSGVASGLIQGTDGNFYGTTAYGGASSWGTVFKMTPAGTLTTLVSFTFQTGAQPRSGLVEGPDGNFYGTTSAGGGSNGGGAIFRVTPAGVLTIVHVFELNPDTNGFHPIDLLLSSDGNFYGTTRYGLGDPLGGGTLFRMTPAGDVTTLFMFPATWVPDSGAIEGSDGVLYGTVTTGGTGLGIAYAITRSGTLVSQASFNGSNGSLPAGGLVETADGKLYGTTSRGNPSGVSNEGTIFRFDPLLTPAITTLARFGAKAAGYAPAAFLRGLDGALYGVTGNYAGTGYGSIFKLTVTGNPPVLSTLTTLATLGAADGTDPSGLIQAADGSLYGTTAHGGPQGGGTIFRVTLAGVLSTVVAFSDGDPVTGSSPRGGVIQGFDGNLYGTTYEGGQNGVGTLFKIVLGSPTPAVTTLLAFGGANGAHPRGPLVRTPAGSLYGTTEAGGANGFGTVFAASTSGVPTSVVPFTGNNGAQPSTGVIYATDGNVYGTAPFGGTFGCGTIYRVSPAGVLTVLFAFPCTYGEHPASALTEGAAGQFYGATDGADVNARLIYGVTSTGYMIGIIRAPGFPAALGLGPMLATSSTDVYGILQGGDLGGGTIYHLTTIRPVAYDVGSVTAPLVLSPRTATTGQLSSSVGAGETREYRILTPPAKGSVQLSIAGDGSFTYTPNVSATGADRFTFTVSTAFGTSNPATVFVSILPSQLPRDFDGDGRADMTLYRPNGDWAILKSSSGYASSKVVNWGGAGYIGVPGDYDGDGQTDPAVYSQATGDWLALTSSSGYTSVFRRNWGGAGYAPVPGDYDGDGKTDPAVFVASTGRWLVLKSEGGYTTAINATLGPGYTPVPGIDFDGDGKSDIVGYAVSSGIWHIVPSSGGFTTATNVGWGGRGYTLVPGDYDGDGKADLALYAPWSGWWYILESHSGYTTTRNRNWGGPGYDAAPADYDGDGIFDVAVVERATGNWSVLRSSTGFTTTLSVTGWGQDVDGIVSGAIRIVSSDLLRATDFDGDGRSDLVVFNGVAREWRVLKSATGYTTSFSIFSAPLNANTTPGDYDGDGRLDFGLYDPVSGLWRVLLSSNGYSYLDQLVKYAGGPGYIAVPADYDGDGRTDLAVYNPATGLWFVRKSSTNFATTLSLFWGGSGYAAAPADFDGDGRTDPAVYRQSSGDWHVLLSSSGYTAALNKNLGGPGYSPVPADFDGDGRAELMVYQAASGLWYGLRSSTGYGTSLWAVWSAGAVYDPMRLDVDGDGRADMAIYSFSAWVALTSSSDFMSVILLNWGGNGYAPVSGYQ